VDRLADIEQLLSRSVHSVNARPILGLHAHVLVECRVRIHGSRSSALAFLRRFKPPTGGVGLALSLFLRETS
jgi:hypothetical protein